MEYSTSSELTRTTKGLDTMLPSSACHGMQADKPCDVSGVSSFAVAAVEYTLAVILHILRVDRDDKGTGYTAAVVAHVSWDTSRQALRYLGGLDSFCGGGGGIHSCGYTPHPSG
jgi:hypothetical protein